MNELSSVVRSVVARHPDAAWEKLCAEVGVAGLTIPARYGGADAGLPEAQLVLEELGRELVNTPYLSVILASHVLVRSGNEDACQRLLPRFADGSLTPALIWDGTYVLDAPVADVFLACVDSELYEVDATVTPCVPMDLTRSLGVVQYEPRQRLGPVDIDDLRDVAAIALSAEQVGAASRALELTVEYAKTRVQFGRPIAAFQALQHRMADLHVLVEAARAVSQAAATGDAPASVAKVYCSEAFLRVASEMIQLHGGMGITWEHRAHQYFKRAHGSAQLFGSPASHVSRLASDL